MSYVRSDGYRLTDPEDDAAFQVVVGDLQRLALNLARGSAASAYTTVADVAAAAPVMKNVHVQMASNFSFSGSGDTIVFDTAISNSDSAYNTSTGVFTAPVTAVYNIGIGFTTSVTRVGAALSDVTSYYNLLKNGISLPRLASPYMSYTANLIATDYTQSLPSALSVSLNAGDTVTLTGATCSSGATTGILVYFRSHFSASWLG